MGARPYVERSPSGLLGLEAPKPPPIRSRISGCSVYPIYPTLYNDVIQHAHSSCPITLRQTLYTGPTSRGEGLSAPSPDPPMLTSQ